MTFDFKKARAYADQVMKNPLLEAIILGSQGAGKSYALGTLGCKTLHLYGTRESHGPKTAGVAGGSNVIPICFDHTETGPLAADDALITLDAILHDYAWMKTEGIQAIALDGMAVLEALVKDTTEWAQKTKNANGKHNTYKETEASMEIIGRVISWLKAAQRELGCHIVVTGILDVRETDQYGGIVEAAPRLQGFGLAEMIAQHFGDVLVVGKMTKDGLTKWKLQFMSDLTKSAKDEHGNQKKAMNFSPRLSGCIAPNLMDADLGKLAAFKAEAMKR